MTTIATTTSPNSQTTPARVWSIDSAHSEFAFSVKHLMISTVRGKFKGVRGTIRGDVRDPATVQIEAEADAATVDTGAADRDGHLRGADFFDVEKYPTLRFVSRRLEPVDENAFKLVGDLTIRDVTREVTFDVEFAGEATDPWGNAKAAATAVTTINRKDWGLNWNAALEAGGVLVADKVKLAIEVQAVKQA